MKALVIGRGSMGRRRIRDLTALGVDVHSWDKTDGDKSAELKAWGEPDVYVTCTPPLQHHRSTYWAKNAGKPAFTEADVEALDLPHFPSATPLFTDWWPYVSDGPAKVSTEYWKWTGQHIDDWHPGATPETYYALRDTSLAIREMVAFELIWLTKLYGPVQTAEALKTATRWDIRLLHQSRVLGRLTIDIESRPAVRRFEAGVGGLAEVIKLAYSEETYLREMRAFVAAVKGESPWPYSQAEEAANLEVLRMIERSG